MFDASGFKLAGTDGVIFAACEAGLVRGVVVVWIEGITNGKRGTDKGFDCGMLRLGWFQ